MSRQDATGVGEWWAQFAAGQRDPAAMDAFAEQVGAAMGRRHPAVLTDPLLYADLKASTRAHWERYLTVETARPQDELPSAVERYAVAVARHGRDLPFLLKVYAVGRSLGWQMLTEAVRAVPDDGPDRAELLMSLWDRLHTMLDASLERVVATYVAERQRLEGGTAAEQAALVERLLADGHGEDAERASLTLRHPLHHQHTAAVMWTDHAHGVAVLEDAARRAAQALGAGAPLVIHRGRTLWCWLATAAPPDLALLAPERERLGTDRVRAAFGTTGPGLRGFRVSHREAVAAHRVAVDTPVDEPITLYADVELVAMLRGVPHEASAFVRRVLGPLADEGPTNDGLRETLLAVLEADGDLARVAAALHVHRNTLRYRLAKAEERLGYRVGERRADVTVALRYLRSARVRRPPSPPDASTR